MSAAVEERMALLGGESTRRGMFSQYSSRQLLVRAAAAAVGLAVLLLTQSVVFLIVLLVVALLVFRYDRGGRAQREKRVDRWRFRVGERTGANEFDPAVSEVPRELGPIRFLAVDTQAEAALALTAQGLDYTAVLEIEGGGDGIRPITETNRRGVSHGRLLQALASTSMPVSQVDIDTRVLPVTARQYAAWLDEHLRTDLPAAVEESMRSGVDAIGEHGEAYRSFMTVRMPSG